MTPHSRSSTSKDISSSRPLSHDARVSYAVDVPPAAVVDSRVSGVQFRAAAMDRKETARRHLEDPAAEPHFLLFCHVHPKAHSGQQPN